jgi:hypothetical protein
MADVIEMLLDSNGFTTNEKQVDMYPERMPNFAPINPLTVILSRIRKLQAKNTEVRWVEEEKNPTVFAATTYHSNSATTLTATYADYLRLEDLLLNTATDEIISIDDTDINAGDLSCTCTRGQLGSTADVINVGDLLLLLAPAKTEGANYTTDKTTVDSEQYNYTQIINKFASISKSANAEATWFGPKRKQGIRKMQDEAYEEIENNLYWSRRSNSAARRTMGGLHWRLSAGTHVNDFNGIMSRTGFDNALTTYREQCPDATNLIFLCPERTRGIINNWAKGMVRINGNDTTNKLGINIDKYIGAIELDIVTAPLMAGNGLNHRGFLLDLDRIALKWLRSPKTIFNSTNSEDPESYRDKFEAELTMIVANEKYHAYFKNMRA